VNLEERKRLLVLACEVDRAAWCHSCRPRPRPAAVRAAQVLNFLEPLLSLIPGRPGRWFRRMGFVAQVVRQVGQIVG
jgi:hypothetical protein